MNFKLKKYYLLYNLFAINLYSHISIKLWSKMCDKKHKLAKELKIYYKDVSFC